MLMRQSIIILSYTITFGTMSVLNYFGAHNHKGTRACEVGPTPIRQACHKATFSICGVSILAPHNRRAIEERFGVAQVVDGERIRDVGCSTIQS